MDLFDTIRWGFKNIIVAELEKRIPWMKPTNDRMEINRNLKKLLIHILIFSTLFIFLFLLLFYLTASELLWIIPVIDTWWIAFFLSPVTIHMLHGIEHKIKVHDMFLLLYFYKFIMDIFMISAVCTVPKERKNALMIGFYIFCIFFYGISSATSVIVYIEHHYLEIEGNRDVETFGNISNDCASVELNT